MSSQAEQYRRRAGCNFRKGHHLKGGLFQMAVDMRPLTREELVRSLPRELERLARSLLGHLRTERPPLGATFIIPSINGFSVVIRGFWRLGMLVGHYPLLLFKGLTFKEA